MPFNGSGTYSPPSNSWNPAVDDTDISATDWASILSDLSTALTTCLTKDGQSTASVRIPFAVGISTAAGVQFPATESSSSDPNNLDDYEEGTFTPIFNFGGLQTGIVYVNQVGRYTKVGNRVITNIYVRVSNKGSATGALTIELLPFTSKNSTGAFAGGGLYPSGMSLAVVYPSWLITSNVTNIAIRNFAAGTDSQVDDTQCTNTLEIALNPSYETAT